MARAVDVPFTNNSADHRRALQLAFEHCATPLTIGTAILFTPSTRVRDSVPPGATTRLSCAAAGVSSGLAGAVKATMIKSKLYQIEAMTVRRDLVYCNFGRLLAGSSSHEGGALDASAGRLVGRTTMGSGAS